MSKLACKAFFICTYLIIPLVNSFSSFICLILYDFVVSEYSSNTNYEKCLDTEIFLITWSQIELHMAHFLRKKSHIWTSFMSVKHITQVPFCFCLLNSESINLTWPNLEVHADSFYFLFLFHGILGKNWPDTHK